MTIARFEKEYGFLSNFYNKAYILIVTDPEITTRIPLFDQNLLTSDVRSCKNTYLFHSVEAAFQACKSTTVKDFCKFVMLHTPSEAKKLGREIKLRRDWDAVKLEIMEQLVRQKFTNSEDLSNLLLSTGDQELIEGNYWKDTYWGVCEGRGENHLGQILMKIRIEIQGEIE